MPEGSGFEPSPTVRCDQYANTAISQYMKNMESACGFTGPAWSPNYNHHFEWCMKVPKERADSGMKMRADELANRCGGTRSTGLRNEGVPVGPDARCDQYAKTAISQNQQNMERACGFTGPAWVSNYSHHYDWCVRVPREQADAGTEMRSNDLQNKCRRIQ